MECQNGIFGFSKYKITEITHHTNQHLNIYEMQKQTWTREPQLSQIMMLINTKAKEMIFQNHLELD